MSDLTLITGGAGFIGSNYASRCISRGEKIVIFDNLSRAGSKRNLAWLEETYGKGTFDLIVGDVRDSAAIQTAARNANRILHLAAQVAVTTSVTDPRNDFEVNAQGTFNTLEAARLSGNKPGFLYSSTNKVYGGMDNVRVVEKETRYDYADLPEGASEEQLLDFHSPYGCSKGCGDQYVRDYARIYELPTVVFRQSCIYGKRQFGVEDQGWVAWFVIAALTGRPISIYGDGKQVRDILFVEDLCDAYDAAFQRLPQVGGEVFNIGGGRKNTISIWMEFKPILEKLLGKKIETTQNDWRPGDQPVFISDIRKANQLLNWTPKVGAEEGISRLFTWVTENKDLF
ncbi:MAG: CDP-paratose 2-epimerase [Chloroflexi bacterium HGW-Chloroflexi-5]|jgi:CDP-paratose 2-epimerase|nr:MAG: CDP-paratose 2-epimerase [Chloroflexi bacterium HGW-Chloroflexi-5]